MSQAKVNQLDVWNGNILVQQHNVFWLGTKKKEEEKRIKEKMVIKALFYVFALGLRWGLVFFFRTKTAQTLSYSCVLSPLP